MNYLSILESFLGFDKPQIHLFLILKYVMHRLGLPLIASLACDVPNDD